MKQVTTAPGKQQRMAEAVARITLSPKIRAGELTDEEINAVTDLFQPFVVGEPVYGPGENQTLRVYDGVLYKAMSDHTTQADWTPDVAGTLWSRVAKTVGGYEVWKAWDGHNENLYQQGAIVWYPAANDQLYIATLGNNHWRPDSGTGWTPYEG
jgi:hypothetical protein